MKLLQQISAAQAFDPGKFLPFEIGEARAGWIRRDLAALLAPLAGHSRDRRASVRLSAAHCERARPHCCARKMTRALANDGTIKGWRDETYAVRIRPQDEPLFHIERAAMRFFGLTSMATHLNGYVRGRKMGSVPIFLIWIARRSATKSIDPGMLDTLVGGGLRRGRTHGMRCCANATRRPGSSDRSRRRRGQLERCRFATRCPRGCTAKCCTRTISKCRGFPAAQRRWRSERIPLPGAGRGCRSHRERRIHCGSGTRGARLSRAAPALARRSAGPRYARSMPGASVVSSR